jgi:cobalt-zinc-cadmium efflux system protein
MHNHADHEHDEHGHDHGGHHHHGHSHASGVTDQKRIAWAFAIIFTFMVVEVIGGIYAGSLALLADAGHMVSDSIALGMSWVALQVGKREANLKHTYGYKRLEVLVAFVNGCTLFVIAAWIVYEAAWRFAEPVHVIGGLMLGVAAAGLVANIGAFYVLNGGNRENLNMRSAWLHVLGDLLGSFIAIVAAGIIMTTGWYMADPLLSIVVALIILKSAGGIVTSSAHILLEGSPEGFDTDALGKDLLANVPALADVHHIHAWSLGSEDCMVTLHVRCKPEADPALVIPAINERLKSQFKITHSTIQVDHAECEDHCSAAPHSHADAH